MISADLLAIARGLATASKGKPKQAELKRAVSSAYYALFHALAFDAANLFANGAYEVDAWRRIYRALDHGPAKAACEAIKAGKFPTSVVACAEAFVRLQIARHQADYDPHHRLARSEANSLVDVAADAVEQLKGTAAPDRLRFATHLLFRQRRS